MAPSAACRGGCRPIALVAGARLAGLAGASGTMPCPDCRHEVRVATSGARLTVPMRPEGGRREGGRVRRFVPVGWREVLDRLAAEARERQVRWVVLDTAVRARFSRVLLDRVSAFLPQPIEIVRSPSPRRLLAEALAPEARPADGPGRFERLRLLVLWGAELGDTGGLGDRWPERARRDGARRVFVGARGGPAAGEADRRIQPLPGTHAAIALGAAHVAREVRGGRETGDPWPPARAAAVAGVSPDEIVWLGRSLADAAGEAMIVVGEEAAAGEAAGLLCRSLGELARTTGAVLAATLEGEPPGSGMPLPVGSAGAVARDAAWFAARLEERDAGSDVVVVSGPDPLTFWPGASILARYLEKARLVVRFALEIQGPTARRADLLLPAPAFFEASDAAAGAGIGPCPWGGQGAVPPPPEVRPPERLWRGLGARLGWPAEWFPEDLGPLLPPCAEGEAPPRGDARVRSRECGGAVLGAEARVAPPARSTAFPLEFVPAPPAPERRLWIGMAPADAEARGLSDGDLVVLRNDRGAVRGRLRVLPEQRTGVVTCPWSGSGGLAGPGPLFGADPDQPFPAFPQTEAVPGPGEGPWEGDLLFSTD
ncbi:MAG: hypothetical protein D6718_07440 [Acidobacteria bacterium]|nr:MAG: hypothetical protein D6718_07440 [Acidobacteriota bacterium]